MPFAVEKPSILGRISDAIAGTAEKYGWLFFAAYGTFLFYLGFLFPLFIPILWPGAYIVAVMARLMSMK